MTKPMKKNIRTLVIVSGMVLAAYIFRFLGFVSAYPKECGLMRSLIYIGLYMAWGFSVRSRILQTQVRRYMTAVASLMVFWFLVRTVKFHFISDALYMVDIARYLWYLFYLPMLFIPLLVVLVALSIGKTEEQPLPKAAGLLCLPAVVLFLLVITNDFHQWVFTFPTEVWTSNDNGYARGYYLIVGWLILCAIGILVLMCIKCRLPGSRKRILLPCIPICILLVYAALYYLQVEWLRWIFGDMTAMTCLLYAATLEVCIRCGFIQANTHYEELFSSAAYLSAQITDNRYLVRYASKNADAIPRRQMKEAEKAPVLLPEGKRLHNMPIHGGHAIWTEDISELSNLREQLEEIKEELKERNALLQYEYEREKEHKVIEEQNRLYDLLQSKTQTQLDQIGSLVLMYQKSDSADEKKQLLLKISVLGSFIKRRKDFVLSLDGTPTIPESKLSGALGESFRALARMNIKGSYLVHTGKAYLSGALLTLAYDFFEDAVEVSWDSLRSINVSVCPVGGLLRISIFADGDADRNALLKKYPAAVISRDTDGVQLVLPLEGGGAK